MVKYYTANVERRNVSENGVCRYAPIHEKSEGCAIGRHLELKVATELDNIAEGITGVSNVEVFSQLPDWMQDLGQGFLESIQNLHDSRENWTWEGLSQTGLYELGRIRERYVE